MDRTFWQQINRYRAGDGLEKLQLIIAKYLENNKVKYLHITGTNGKGSVSRFIYAVLTQSLTAQKIGLFTSPHIIDVNERIIVNNEPISDQDLWRIKALISDDIEKYQLMFFDILTLIALIYFDEQQVDWAVIEVGIGGKSDATNVIDGIYAVITSIAKDHTEYLGTTLQAILSQKLGIVKPNTSILFVSGNLNQKCKNLMREWGYQPHYSPQLINCSYYEENKNLALTVIKTAFPAINGQQALTIINNTKISLRFEKYLINDKTIYLDVAHNLAGIKALVKALKLAKVKVEQIIFSCLKLKRPEKLLNALTALSNNIIICRNSHQESIDGIVFDYQTMIAEQKNKVILITGSCYFLGDVYNVLISNQIFSNKITI